MSCIHTYQKVTRTKLENNLKNHKIDLFAPNKFSSPTGRNFQNILILKHDFKYCRCPIEGFSLIFFPLLTHKSEVVISKISVCLGSPCSWAWAEVMVLIGSIWFLNSLVFHLSAIETLDEKYILNKFTFKWNRLEC